MGAYRENLKYWVFNQYKMKFPIFSGGGGGGGGAPILPPLECVLHTLPEVLQPPPPLLLRQYTGSASGPYRSKTAASGPALHIIIRYMHTRTHRDRHMDAHIM